MALVIRVSGISKNLYYTTSSLKPIQVLHAQYPLAGVVLGCRPSFIDRLLWFLGRYKVTTPRSAANCAASEPQIVGE
jgi:hypothetical protein